jgi:hypothetical protein
VIEIRGRNLSRNLAARRAFRIRASLHLDLRAKVRHTPLHVQLQRAVNAIVFDSFVTKDDGVLLREKTVECLETFALQTRLSSDSGRGPRSAAMSLRLTLMPWRESSSEPVGAHYLSWQPIPEGL